MRYVRNAHVTHPATATSVRIAIDARFLRVEADPPHTGSQAGQQHDNQSLASRPRVSLHLLVGAGVERCGSDHSSKEVPATA